jgi:hypothetical protein
MLFKNRTIAAVPTVPALVVLLLAVLPSPAHANEPAPVVMLLPDASNDAIYRAADAIAAQLTDIPVHFIAQRVEGWENEFHHRVDRARHIAESRSAISVFWIDLSAPQQVFLFIEDPSGGRILVRNIRSGEGGEEAQFETLAVIVRGAIKSILDGGRIGVSAPPPKPAQTQPAFERINISIAYAAKFYSREALIAHGARVEISLGIFRQLRVFAAYRLQFPLHLTTDLVAADIHPHPLELGLAGRWRSPKWILEIGLAVVEDFVTFEVMALDNLVEPFEPKRKYVTSISPSVRIGRRVADVATVFLSINLDVALVNNRYVIETTGDPIVITTPWRLGPLFALGMTFTLL